MVITELDGPVHGAYADVVNAITADGSILFLGDHDQAERRAVIELWVKVGKIHEKAQFTLADRSQMSHPVLLGREFIKDIALVDVSKKYVQTEVK